MEIQRESIFVSSLRGFFKTLFVFLGAVFSLVLTGFIFTALNPSSLLQEKTSLEILPNLSWQQEVAPLSAPVILQLNVHGIIGDPEGLDSTSAQNIFVDSRKGLLHNNRVKGILLHFNTPGGTVTDADAIYRMLLKYKTLYNVPVFGYVDGLCASGGMYIASAADRIYAGPAAIVGSIGVISGPFFNVSDAIAKIGVTAKTLTQGIGKDDMNPFRPWAPNEDHNLNALIAGYYRQFVAIVTKARPRLDETKLLEVYGAGVFDGQTAENYGYVDKAGSSYDEAVLALLQAANLDPEHPYQIVQLKPHRGLLADLVRGSPLFSGKLNHNFSLSGHKSFTIQEPVAYLYQP